MLFCFIGIEALAHLYQINPINNCSGYKSTNLISTKSNEVIDFVANSPLQSAMEQYPIKAYVTILAYWKNK